MHFDTGATGALLDPDFHILERMLRILLVKMVSPRCFFPFPTRPDPPDHQGKHSQGNGYDDWNSAEQKSA